MYKKEKHLYFKVTIKKIKKIFDTIMTNVTFLLILRMILYSSHFIDARSEN